jgi:hypothetical protein
MDSYTITITPNDDSGNSTTLTVDTTTGQARITSVHLHAPAGLTSGQLPSVDVGLLLQAVTGPTTPAAITATPPPAAEVAPHPAPTDTDAPTPTAATTTPQPATGDPTPRPPAKRAGRRTAADARTAENDKPRSSATRRSRNQPTPKTDTPRKTVAPRNTAGKRVTATAAAASAERVYRKMPDDFAAVYR